MKIVMRALCIVICIVGTLRIEAAVTHIENQDAFGQELKTHKRLVAVVLDRSQIKGDATKVLDALNRMLGILSNDHAYRLSRIGFATVDFGSLAQDTQTELLTALGGKLNAPITVVLFYKGSLVMADKMPITEVDVLEKESGIAQEIAQAIGQSWGSHIEHSIEKCDHADCSRKLSEEQKVASATDYKNIEQKARKMVEVAPKQASGARVYTYYTSPSSSYYSTPVSTYYTSPTYSSSYYSQPEYTYTYPSYSYVSGYDYYDDEDYYPSYRYYDYPYYGGYSYGYPFFGVGFGRGRRYWGGRGWHGGARRR